MQDYEKIELRSEEVQEILSRPPHALVRYGIMLIGAIVMILVIGSFIFKYPDIIQGNIVITTENPPVWLVAKSTGEIKALLCTDKQVVDSGKPLLVIENSAVTNDIFALANLLKQVEISDTFVIIPSEITTRIFRLGEIQSSFSSFAQAAINYENLKSFNPAIDQIENTQKQLHERKAYLSNLREQLKLMERDVELSTSMYQREKGLYQAKINSQYEMENNEQAYISKKQAYLQLKTSIALAEIENSQLKGSVKQLSTQQIHDKNEIVTTLKSSYRELQTSLDKWMQNYVLISPRNGVVTFNSFWKENQFISAGDKVLAIVPQKSGKYVGKLQLPMDGSGKIKTGQKVNIKIAGYPYLQFGMLKGSVTNKSLVPNDSFYTIEINLTNGLHSTTGKDFKFTGELTGTAEIITEDLTLFQRFYAPLKYLTHKALD